MTTPSLARALDDDLDAFARAIIDRNPQRLLTQAQLLVDQAARLISLQHGHVPPHVLQALARASRAAAAYDFPKFVREIHEALAIA